ncbi:MAG: hypothetical protein JNL11_00170 [Bdellovibrionaceae bacterium]|nr:hypothetical protein [Pseudobdellovibrionaceae bacterium]
MKIPNVRHIKQQRLQMLDKAIEQIKNHSLEDMSRGDGSHLHLVNKLLKELGPLAVDRLDTYIDAFFAHPGTSKFLGTSLSRNPGYFLIQATTVGSPLRKHTLHRIYQRLLIETNVVKRDQYASFLYQYGANAVGEIVAHITQSLSHPEKLSDTQLENILSATVNLTRPQWDRALTTAQSARLYHESPYNKYFYHFFEMGHSESWASLSDSQLQALQKAVQSLAQSKHLKGNAEVQYLIARVFLNRFELTEAEAARLAELSAQHVWPKEQYEVQVYGGGKEMREDWSGKMDYATMDLWYAHTLQTKSGDNEQ